MRVLLQPKGQWLGVLQQLGVPQQGAQHLSPLPDPATGRGKFLSVSGYLVLLLGWADAVSLSQRSKVARGRLQLARMHRPGRDPRHRGAAECIAGLVSPGDSRGAAAPLVTGAAHCSRAARRCAAGLEAPGRQGSSQRHGGPSEHGGHLATLQLGPRWAACGYPKETVASQGSKMICGESKSTSS